MRSTLSRRVSLLSRCLGSLLTIPIIFIISGCGSHSAPPPLTLSLIAISPGTDSLSCGATQQFKATATYNNGTTADVTAQAAWSSSNAAVATINASGILNAVAAGTATIVASLNDKSGSSSLTVTPPVPVKTLTSIAITPANASFVVGGTQQFTATGSYNDGSTADVTSTASWSITNTAIGTINPAGLAAGVAAGSDSVTATLQGVTGTATFTVTTAVTTPTLVSISLTPATASIAIGATQQFTATGTYSDGRTANITSTATWSITNTATAIINATGLATGVAAGTTNITATLSGITGSSVLTVTTPVIPPTLVSITLTPASASIATGATQQFTATGAYSDGSTANVSSTTAWSVGNATVATISGTGLATAASAGSTTIAASLNGMSGTATLTVTAAAKSIASIAVSPANATFAAGAGQQFIATATYTDATTGDITSTVAWSTGNPAVATIAVGGLATGVSSGSTSVTAAQSGISATTSFTVSAKTLKSIAVTSATASFAIGGTQQYTATATYTDGTTGNITSTATWSIANTSVATITANGFASGVAAGSTSVQASLSGVSGSTPLTVTIAPGTGVNVATWHYDNNRSGLNPGELSLTPANVSAANFGKLFSYQLDGYAYAEPLLVSNLTINGTARSVLFVATENDSVYAFDADNHGAGTPLWQVSLLQSGETPLTGAPIKPVEGITSTPVIDASTNTIYVVSTQTSTSAPASFRLNALDLATGAQKPGSPVTLQASVPGTGNTSVNGVVSLNTSCMQRAALLEANSTIYIGFGSCQRGWLLAYDAQTLAQVGVFNSSPNLNGEGTYMSAGGIWMSGGGPAADSSGNVYAVTGNGPWDGQTAWSDSVLKFNPKLQLTDWFTPDSYQYMDCADADLASGGLLLIPGANQALAGGKIGKLFLVSTTSMGHEATGDTGATQTLWFESDLIKPYSASCTDTAGVNTTDINPYEIFGTAAYFNGSVYLGITPTGANIPSGVRQFTYNGALTPGPITTPSIQENTRGTTPFISANGSTSGVLWMIDTGQPIQNGAGNAPTSAVLRAYDATHYPNELYSSSTNTADTPGYGIKFSSPIVANGKVYISTAHDVNTVANPKGEVDVYGLK